MFARYVKRSSDELLINLTNFVIYRARQLVKLSGIKDPPFLPEKFAPFQQLNKISKEDLGELSGLLIPSKNGFEIKVNITHSPERQNFSVAHEIGHTIFWEKGFKVLLEKIKQNISEKRAKKYEEDLCDIFASELLMPYSVYIKYAKRYYFNINSISILSRLFNVSIVPAALRLCDVNPRECLLIYWIRENSGEIINPKLKSSWMTWSQKKPLINANRFIKRKFLDSDFEVLAAYKSENHIYTCKRIKIGNYIGNYQIWSKGFGSGNDRFVLSFAFPEKLNS
jgi:Zn-dependent peptidase ImmA (M78 family)